MQPQLNSLERNLTLCIPPFKARNKVTIMTAVSYETPNERRQFDVNVHWYDRTILPNTQRNSKSYRHQSKSEPYITLNIYTTAKMNKFEMYGGCENITDYKQSNPIIGFKRYFWCLLGYIIRIVTNP